MRFQSAVLAVALVAVTAPSVLARQIPSLGETLEIAIVNVDVVVTDRDGKRVRGLTKGDFEIYENGKVQPLSHFAEYRDDASEGSAAAGGAETTAPEQRRTMVLFLENFRLQNFRVEPYIESLKTLVRESIRPGDTISIVTFREDAETLVEPTDDVAAIEAALDLYGEELIGVRYDRASAVAEEVQMMQDFEAKGAALASSKGIMRPVSSGESLASNAAYSEAMNAEFEMRRRITAVNAIVNGLAGVDGKKMVIVAAHRLGSYSGAEFYYSGGMTRLNPGEMDRFDNRKRAREMIANANAAGVSLYPIFPAGLDQTPVSPGAPDVTRQVLQNEMAMREEIAKETGGLTTYGAQQIVTLLPQVADDMANYYSLAYRASTRRADQARDLEVKAKDRNLRVRARTQFVEKSDESRMKDRVLAAMYGVSRESPIQLAATLGKPAGKGRQRRSVPLSVRVPIGALTLVPQGKKEAGAFSVYVLTGAERGEVSEVTRRTQPFEIPAADVAKASAGHFTYEMDVVVNNGADHIAIGVIDEVSKNFGVVRLALPQAN